MLNRAPTVRRASHIPTVCTSSDVFCLKYALSAGGLKHNIVLVDDHTTSSTASSQSTRHNLRYLIQGLSRKLTLRAASHPYSNVAQGRNGVRDATASGMPECGAITYIRPAVLGGPPICNGGSLCVVSLAAHRYLRQPKLPGTACATKTTTQPKEHPHSQL